MYLKNKIHPDLLDQIVGPVSGVSKAVSNEPESAKRVPVLTAAQQQRLDLNAKKLDAKEKRDAAKAAQAEKEALPGKMLRQNGIQVC